MEHSKSTYLTLFVLVVIAVAAIYFVIIAQDKQAERKLQASPVAQALQAGTTTNSFVNFDGETVVFDDYLGKVFVVTSWASWSPFSAEDLRLLATISSEYSNDEVAVVGVNRAEGKFTAQQYLQSIGVADEVPLVIDAQDQYYKAIEGYTMPETVVYDQAGDVLLHVRGPLRADQLRQQIDAALQTDY